MFLAGCSQLGCSRTIGYDWLYPSVTLGRFMSHVDWNSMQAGWSLNLVSPGPSWVYTPAVSLAYLPYVHG